MTSGSLFTAQTLTYDPIALLLRKRTADGDEKERGKDTEFVREIVVSVGVQMVQNELRHDFTGRLSLPL